MNNKAELGAAFGLVAALASGGCTVIQTGPYGVAATEAEARENLKWQDGIFYIFDLQNRTATLSVNDKADMAANLNMQFNFTQPVDAFPSAVAEKFEAAAKIARNQAGEPQGNFVIWRQTARDPGLNDSRRIANVVADPLSGILCVINTQDGESGAPLMGNCGDHANYPEFIRRQYEDDRNVLKEQGYIVNDYVPKAP